MGYQRDERVEWQMAKNGMYLDCPYNKEFIEEMKGVVPLEERKWEPGRKQWWISDAYIDEVDNLLFSHFETNGSGRDL